MAYQQAAGMTGGPSHANNEHAPQGTEYTLQGVMRFLQIEWHNHERARNAWDIERAEMKAKIAKQEGEIRHGRKLNDQLDKQVRMLENALKSERAKSRGTNVPESTTKDGEAAMLNGSKSDVKSGSKDKSRDVSRNAFLDTSEQPHITAEEKEKYRDKSRKYLERCMQEIQYLLSPPPHPPPPQMNMPNGSLTGLPEPPPSLDDVLARQRQRMQAPQGQVPIQASLLNHQAPASARFPEVSNFATSPATDTSYVNREPAFPPPQQLPRPSEQVPDQVTQPSAVPQMSMQLDEPTETVTHSYDSYGRPVAPEDGVPIIRQDSNDTSDGWNFGDSQILPDPAQPEAQTPRRPDQDLFPSVNSLPAKSPPRTGPGSHRRKSSGSSNMSRRRSAGSQETTDSGVEVSPKHDPLAFKVKFALRGHLDVVRSVIFTGGGSPSEPEICTAGDDGTIKRWIIPASYSNFQHAHLIDDLDISCYFTHRGHEGIITSLAACPSTAFSTGGRSSGDGWIFSGGQDATIRVWERGRVDPKATLYGHTDTIWTVCVLPGTTGSVFGSQSNKFGGSDRILLASGSADGTVKIWAVSAPPQLAAPQAGPRRGVGGSRRHSVTSGSNHPNSPQPTVATNTPFHYTLVHSISRPEVSQAIPTCISPLNPNGENFVVSYTDSCILIFDTRTGEEVIGMASNETFDGTPFTSINTIVATSSASLGLDAAQTWGERSEQEENVGAGPTGSAQGVEGVVVSGHEDRYIRFFDANSGQCTYTMLAHPSAISSLSLSHDGHEAVSAGHDASIRFWSLDKRICTQDITSHRPMRGEGVCSVVWSQDGRYVVSAGGDGVVKVFAR